MCWEAVPETNDPNRQVKLYLHKSFLERYVHNFSGLPLVVLLMLRCKILGRVGLYLPVKIL